MSRSVTVLLWLLWLLTGCAAPPVPSAVEEREPRTEVIYVFAPGWHTEIAVPVELMDHPLTSIARGFPGARYVVFGWGARDYYMARDPGFGDLLRAAFSGPAVMLVFPLYAAPGSFIDPAKTLPVRISPAGAARLSRFLWEDLATDAAGSPIRVGRGPYPQSAFYESVRTYSLSYTCNTWTAAALETAGAAVSPAGVHTAGQVVEQLRRVRETPAGGR